MRWLTPLGEFESEFLINPAEDQNDDEIEDRGGNTGQGWSLRSEDAFGASEQSDCDEDSIKNDRQNEYQHHARLHTQTVKYNTIQY